MGHKVVSEDCNLEYRLKKNTSFSLDFLDEGFPIVLRCFPCFAIAYYIHTFSALPARNEDLVSWAWELTITSSHEAYDVHFIVLFKFQMFKVVFAEVVKMILWGNKCDFKKRYQKIAGKSDAHVNGDELFRRRKYDENRSEEQYANDFCRLRIRLASMRCARKRRIARTLRLAIQHSFLTRRWISR